MIKSVVKRISYWFFPRRCDLCGEVVELNTKRCQNCSSANRIVEERCYDCGLGKSKCLCKNHKHKNHYKMIVAPYYYDELLVAGVHRFKFGGYGELAKAMSAEMINCIKQEYKDVHFDAVTYVPLTEKRQKARGYNQSKLLASYISNALNVPLEDTLFRELEDNPLRGKSALARKSDIFGAFDINKNIDANGKTYLLIDDVKSTGATLNECAATLDIYGASAVYCATFAIK